MVRHLVVLKIAVAHSRNGNISRWNENILKHYGTMTHGEWVKVGWQELAILIDNYAWPNGHGKIQNVLGYI